MGAGPSARKPQAEAGPGKNILLGRRRGQRQGPTIHVRLITDRGDKEKPCRVIKNPMMHGTALPATQKEQNPGQSPEKLCTGRLRKKGSRNYPKTTARGARAAYEVLMVRRFLSEGGLASWQCTVHPQDRGPSQTKRFLIKTTLLRWS